MSIEQYFSAIPHGGTNVGKFSALVYITSSIKTQKKTHVVLKYLNPHVTFYLRAFAISRWHPSFLPNKGSQSNLQ